VGLKLALRAPDKAATTGVISLDRLGTRYGLRAATPVFRQAARQKTLMAQAGLSPQADLGDIYKLTFSADVDVLDVVAAYAADPTVVYAEPDYFFEFDGVPDDPYFGQQWHLHNTGQYYLEDADIDAPEAWDIVTGTETMVIAVIDTGVDRDHLDLAERIWANPGETPGDSIDNDGNGYTDDTWGWNWVSDVSDPDDYEFNDPRDDNGHGTHVAGIAAAATNNATGVAGVCWNCRIMSLKAFESNGVGTTSDIVQAINYAASKGAHVINMSFGSYAESLLLEDTLAAAYGQAVLVAAAGNYGKTLYATVPYYPASYPYVLGVGATDVGCVERDKITLACLLVDEHRADFSNYGINTDVGAPGVSIYSTFRGGGYANLSGTSMATPMVSGLAALLLSKNPSWSKEMARGQIIQTAEAIYTGEFSRVNAYDAVTVVPTPDVTLLGDSILYGDASGDNDGIPDAGETFSVTMLLKNYWGEAMTTTAVLSTSDPYVTLVEDTATFGDISAYATMRNSATPFQVTLDPTAPNNHLVDFSLSITANGGAYATAAEFSFLVQRGIELPGPLFPAVITQSMTLYNDYLYIVKQNMLVAQGVTLTIEPGTRLQYDPGKFIKIQGTLIASGTAELPIYFTSNQKDPQPGDFQGIIFDDQAVDATLVPTPTVTIIATEGAAIPEIGTVISLTTPPQLIGTGDVYFSALIDSAPDYEGIFYWMDEIGVFPLVKAGDAAPGGGQFVSFPQFYAADNGDLYFIAQVISGTLTSGVFKQTVDGLTAIVRAGDAVPGVSGGTFTGFKHLAVGSDLVAFAGTYDDGIGGSGVGLYVKRNDLNRLLRVPIGDVMGPVLDVTAVWYPSILSGPGATISGTAQIVLTYANYDSTYQRYSASAAWQNGNTTLLGGSYQPGINDRMYPLDAWYTVMTISGGSVPRALFRCGPMWNCTELNQVVLKDGDLLPGGGILDLSGPFDLGWDGSHLVFRAVVSGTSTTRLVRILDDGALENVFTEGFPLPDGTTVSGFGALPAGPFANAFGEFALRVDTAAGQRIIQTELSDEYVSGNILNHIILEYGGGLLIDDSFPYVANSTFRYNRGAIPAGSSEPHGAVTVMRQTPSNSGLLVLRGNTIRDNPSHGVYIHRGGSGQVFLRENQILNNLPHWPVIVYYQGAGLHLVYSDLAVDIHNNQIQYNRAYYCGGFDAESGDRLRLEGNEVTRNQAFAEGGGGGGGCLGYSSPLLRRNVIGGNIDQNGHEPGNGNEYFGGSALKIFEAGPIMQFNTVTGNEARPSYDLRTAPGNTIAFVQGASGKFTHNNILGNQASFDLYLSNYQSLRQDVDAVYNYWGTTDANDIRYNRIYDYWQDFNPGEATFQPFLTAPEPLAPGFLWNATTTPPSPVGAEPMTVTLDFSRDMNTAITPTVTFGVDEPYTQHRIENGQWISPTRWVGSFDVTVDTGDGINTLKVSEAKDSGGMRIPEDTRFSFVIQTAGTQSILLEAAATVSQVALTWTQNDVTDLAGYILYRSPYTNTGYTQIGGGMFVDTAYTDTSVTNGVTYYYKYSVLDTDFNEVAWSNEVSVTPDDYTLPTTPIVIDDGATTNYFDRLHASWSAADPETGVAEYQVCVGTAPDNCHLIAWTAMGLTTTQTWTGLNLANGATYYVNVQARNTANHWSAIGSSDGITVAKLPAPVITAVEPVSGVRNVAHVITLTGNGFQASPAPTVRLGGTTLGGVVVIDAVRLTAQVPAGIATGVYTATVTNFDTQIGSLVRAYTATNPTTGPRPLLFSPTPRLLGDDETSTTVDVIVQDVSDLAAFQFDMMYDPAVVQVSDVTLGWFLASSGRTTAALGPQIDNGAGQVTFGGISYGAAPGAEGSGTLATLTFTPQSTGTTSLNFANVQLRDSLNSEIPTELQSGQIWVVQYPFGDLDRDCDVDVNDIMQVAWRWMDPANYDVRYDFDADSDIDVADIMQVAAAWGDVCVGGPSVQSQSYALDGPVLRLTGPANNAIRAGDVFTVALQVEEAVDLAAYQLELAYDPVRMAVVDVSYTDLLSTGGNTVATLGPTVDESGGRITLAGFGYGGARGVDGSGALVLVSMQALDNGLHSLDPVAAILVNQRGVLMMPGSLVGWLSRGQTIYLPLVLRGH